MMSVKQSERKTMLRHNMRDVERSQGMEAQHSNETIDPARTARNRTWIPSVEPPEYEGPLSWTRASSTAEVMRRMDDLTGRAQRYRTLKDGRRVPVALRKDSAVAIEMLIQLDPDFTGPAEDVTEEKRAEIERYHWAALTWLTEEFGDRVVMAAEHWDETSPHLQAWVVPLTEDEELNKAAFLTGVKRPGKARSQKAYTELHDSLRTALRESGYDATYERVDGGKKPEDLAKFKKQAGRATKQQVEELERERAELERTAQEMGEALGRERAELDERWDELDERWDKLNETIVDLQGVEEQQAAERADLGRREIEVERLEQWWDAADARAAVADRAIKVAKDAVSKAAELQAELREMHLSETARTRVNEVGDELGKVARSVNFQAEQVDEHRGFEPGSAAHTAFLQRLSRGGNQPRGGEPGPAGPLIGM